MARNRTGTSGASEEFLRPLGLADPVHLDDDHAFAADVGQVDEHYQAYLDAERRRHPVRRLTSRQTELLRLVAAGHTNTQIARRLGMTEGTVRTHLENIYERLDVSSRTAVIRAFPGRIA